MGVLGGVFVLKSGLRILIRAPQVPFSVPQNGQKSLFRGPKWFPKCLNEGFRGVFILKSGLRILI